MPKFDSGLIVQAGTGRTLSEEEMKAYRAPFPDDRYMAGPRVMPTLVASQQATNRKAWQALEQFEKPFLTLFSDGDPITAGGQAAFLKRVLGTKGQPHATIEKAGHFLQEDAGAELARRINEFIAANR